MAVKIRSFDIFQHLLTDYNLSNTMVSTLKLVKCTKLFICKLQGAAFAARSLKKKQNDKIFIQPFVDDAKCGECHINMYTNVQMYLNDDRLHLENHRSGNNTRLSAVQNAVLSSVCFTTVCQFLSTYEQIRNPNLFIVSTHNYSRDFTLNKLSVSAYEVNFANDQYIDLSTT